MFKEWKIVQVLNFVISPTSMKKLHKKLWKIVSDRVRNSSDHCYTCGKYLSFDQRAAGHFYSKKAHPSVMYDLDNLRVQCFNCNSVLSGNIKAYKPRLEQELGSRFIDLTIRANTAHKWTKEQLQLLINNL